MNEDTKQELISLTMTAMTANLLLLRGVEDDMEVVENSIRIVIHCAEASYALGLTRKESADCIKNSFAQANELGIALEMEILNDGSEQSWN